MLKKVPVYVKPFWERKSLEEMSPEEWESLCDGCGKCCLFKIEMKEKGRIHYTDIACKHFDSLSCRCTSYKNRGELNKDCEILTPQKVRKFYWLPKTCAYRRLALGKPLLRWHHLISGDPELIHQLGFSVKNKTVSENIFSPIQLKEYMRNLLERF